MACGRAADGAVDVRRVSSRAVALPLALVLLSGPPAAAQVQIRLGDPSRADYSELHEGLRAGTSAADAVSRILGEPHASRLGQILQQALDDRRPWNDGLLALTRLAELRVPAWGDSARLMLTSIEDERLRVPPGRDRWDLVQPLRALLLELERASKSDNALRDEILGRVPAGEYGLAEAWVLGRLAPPAADSLRARFLAASDEQLKVRYLTLLSFSTDTANIPLLARVFAAPDSFGIPLRYGARASDGLLWIGTRGALAALQRAREVARTRGVYADSQLMRDGFDFLANDSAAVVARTGKWLDEWLLVLR